MQAEALQEVGLERRMTGSRDSHTQDLSECGRYLGNIRQP